ncbi:MAG: tetratricopeptide repeat protein, partial [Candidatus Eisenbacteria bacterium]|nr:tetratricopeptide repeat protein [Candidatus Eisenbacteria bacterium]
MAEDREQRLREVFAEAMALEPANRAAFLLRACGPDEALRVEVESLLDAHERAGSFLESPALLDLTERDLQERMPVHLGRQIGPYRLVTEIGVGGMGTVYLGERADGSFEQRVAVKLLRFGLGTSELRRAFENERRILARLEHPNIARLIDGGTTEDGTPYLAMEYVPGIPIDQYCNEGTLSVPARVEIMRTVCDAVHHAHRNLVVHRDLKPSNILVDESGRVKLLDFGIAKVIVPDLPDAGGSTRTRVPALTPRYASPEQLRGEPVTTASDVYSLGVVLYELLVGASPYAEPSEDGEGLARYVLDRDPMRPSDAVRLQEPADPPVTTRRERTRLARELVGDLDTIVMQCLRKEPGRRYASAEQLGEDLRRYLSGLPVRARPDTFRYRSSKFVRRHPGSVIAGTFAVLTLITASLVSTGLYLRAIHAREDADRSRAAAQEVSAFLQEVLGSIDPQVAQGRDVTLLQEVLDRAASRLEHELEGASEVAGELHLTIGRAYRSLGLYEPAEHHLAAAVATHREFDGEASPAAAESQVALARLYTDLGRYPEAAELAQEAVRTLRKASALPEGAHDRTADGTVHLAAALSALATVREAEGAMEDAEAGHREALSVAQDGFPADDPRTAEFLNNLGVFLSANDRREEAEPLLRQGIEILRRGPEEKPVDLSIALHNLATLLRREGRPSEAAALYREALGRMREVYPDDHPQIAVTLNNLASALESEGDLEAAERTYREALDLQQR